MLAVAGPEDDVMACERKPRGTASAMMNGTRQLHLGGVPGGPEMQQNRWFHRDISGAAYASIDWYTGTARVAEATSFAVLSAVDQALGFVWIKIIQATLTQRLDLPCPPLRYANAAEAIATA